MRPVARAKILLCAGTLAAIASAAAAWSGQSPERGDATDLFVACERSQTVRLEIGLRLRAVNGAMKQGVASFPIPIEWPEQQVRLLGTTDDRLPTDTRRLGGTAEQLLVRLANLAEGSEVEYVCTYELTRWTQRLRPETRGELTVAKSAEARAHLLPSDGIEAKHPEIRRFAEEAVGDRSDALDRVTALFQATQQRVRYKEGPFAGALAGLRSGEGDCEERTCLFIAACRASGVPARLVWAPNHCWAEVAMSDQAGKLVWVPTDPTREREFGVISHFYPIVQKGDRFRIPESKEPVRYLAPRCTGVGSPPQLEFIERFEVDEEKATEPSANPRAAKRNRPE